MVECLEAVGLDETRDAGRLEGRGDEVRLEIHHAAVPVHHEVYERLGAALPLAVALERTKAIHRAAADAVD